MKANQDAPITEGNLIGVNPADILQYGPSKLYVDAYHWHEPTRGIIASYSPTPENVIDHFGIFRGVDQVEAFAQASIVSCAGYLECLKQNCSLNELRDRFLPAFISIGAINFHHYLQAGDRFICIAEIKFYKFRQMVASGRIYKVPDGLDITAYFKHFTASQVFGFEFDPAFILVAELADITGRALKKEIFNQKT